MKVKVEILKGAPKPDLTLEPFFRGREEAKIIRLLQSVHAVRRFAVVFERNGCVRCQTRALPHGGHGFCTKCRRWFYNEIAKAERDIAAGEV